MRVIGAARGALRELPAGVLKVGGGLLVLGISSYGFLIVSARSLTPQSFAGLSVLYVLVYTIGPGLFLPFEQEIGRALSGRHVHGLGGGPLLRRALLLGTSVLVVLLLAIAAVAPVLTRRLFDGSWLLFAGLLLSAVGLCGAHLSRGSFAGSGRFAAYGGQLATEGLTRLVACIALAVAGVHAVGAYGLLLGGAFVVSVLVTGRFVPSITESGPQAHWDELIPAIGWLVAGSVLSQMLVNAGPVAVKLLATSAQAEAAGQLLAGLVLARLPLFLFAAVQAALLPQLAALVAKGRVSQFRTGVRRLLLTVLALSAVTVFVLAVAGPTILHLLFGSRFHLGRLDLVLLSTATGFFMAANVLSNALLALQRFGYAAAGWAIGVAVLAALIAVPSSLFARVEHSFLLGAVSSVAAFALLLRSSLSHPRTSVRARVPDVVVGP